MTRRPSRRGGRRPGAGAKPGNLNALKTGVGSKRVLALRAALQATETTRIMCDVARADQSRVVMAARSLYHVADLMLISRGVNPADVHCRDAASQQKARRMRQTARQSHVTDLGRIQVVFPSDINRAARLLQEHAALSVLPWGVHREDSTEARQP